MPGLRLSRTSRGGRWLAAAAAIGLLAAIATVRSGDSAELGGRIVVARAPLPSGLVLDDRTAAAALMVVAVPDVDLPGLFADPTQVVGRRVAAPVGPGEPLSEAALGGAPGSGPEPLAVGQRAVAVPLSAAGGLAAGLAPGGRVDVVASTGEGLAGTTALVVADAEVLAVSVPSGEEGLGMTGDALLRVSARQALRITAALNFAREVRLLVRPAEEVGPPRGPREASAP